MKQLPIILLLCVLFSSCTTTRNLVKTKTDSTSVTSDVKWETIERTDMGTITTQTRTVTVTDFAVMRNPTTGALESTPEKQTQTVDKTVVENKDEREQKAQGQESLNATSLSHNDKAVITKRKQIPFYIIVSIALIGVFILFFYKRKWISRVFGFP